MSALDVVLLALGCTIAFVGWCIIRAGDDDR